MNDELKKTIKEIETKLKRRGRLESMFKEIKEMYGTDYYLNSKSKEIAIQTDKKELK